MSDNNPGYSYAPPPSGRVPLGARTGQRVVTWILLGLSVLGFVGTLISPPTPLMFAFDAAARFDVSSTAASVYVVALVLIVIVFVASWVISLILLAHKRVAFYVPLAAGVLASIVAGFASLSGHLGL